MWIGAETADKSVFRYIFDWRKSIKQSRIELYAHFEVLLNDFFFKCVLVIIIIQKIFLRKLMPYVLLIIEYCIRIWEQETVVKETFLPNMTRINVKQYMVRVWYIKQQWPYQLDSIPTSESKKIHNIMQIIQNLLTIMNTYVPSN